MEKWVEFSGVFSKNTGAEKVKLSKGTQEGDTLRRTGMGLQGEDPWPWLLPWPAGMNEGMGEFSACQQR